METTIKQQVLTKITSLPDNTSFEEILKTLRALRPKTSAAARRHARPNKQVSCLELAKPVIGLIDGPEDLSTNKAYFQGLGE